MRVHSSTVEQQPFKLLVEGPNPPGRTESYQTKNHLEG